MAWDDLCTICGEAKKPHLKKHQFTTEDDPQLVPVDRSRPPVKQEATAEGNAIASRTILRLIEVLSKKGLFTGDELLFIIGGRKDEPTSSDNDTDGDTGQGSEGDGSS